MPKPRQSINYPPVIKKIMATRVPHTQPRWHRRPEDRPEEILTAAIELFGEVGFARTKLEDVAKRAGVSKGTLYL